MLARDVYRKLAVLAIATVGGCTNTLETGYKPRPLNSSTTVRQAYYASPFTQKAQAAQYEREKELEQRRPRPGY